MVSLSPERVELGVSTLPTSESLSDTTPPSSQTVDTPNHNNNSNAPSMVGIKAEEVPSLVFHKMPLSTTWYSIVVVRDFLVSTIKSIGTHWFFLAVVLPISIVWAALAHVEGSHTPMVAEATLNLRFVSWWFLLGVLSSIGLGSGMHTGMVFLFPHILKVVYTAEKCHHLDFDTRQNIWFNPEIPTTDLDFDCIERPDDPLPDFWALYNKVIVACVVWGIGTAAGEIPPYQFSYMAAVAGEKNEELENELSDAKASDEDTFAVRQFKSMKNWMIDFIKRHGFLGVYLMAAWPNAAFDLCGMCCGHFKMEFWTFFGATLLGKAFTLRPIQTGLFVASFSNRYRPVMIHAIGGLFPYIGTPIATFASKKIDEFIATVSSGGDASPSAGYFAMAWGMFVVSLVLYFIKTSLEAFAQQHVLEVIKKETIERKRE